MKIRSSKKFLILPLLLILIIENLMSCQSSAVRSPTLTSMPSSSPLPFAENIPPTKTPTVTRQLSLTIQATSTAAPFATAVSSETSQPLITATPIIPGLVTQPLLLFIQEDRAAATRSTGSIWILSTGETTPQRLLRDQQYSYEAPAWSNDGNWIAFLQRDSLADSGYQIGIIRKDGAEKQIFREKYGGVSWLSWSANDRMLIGLIGDCCTSSGVSPFILDVASRKATNLFSDSKYHFDKAWVKPSPSENLLAFVGATDEPGPVMELWFLSLSSDRQEKAELPEGIQQCSDGLRMMEWSPDGNALLVQFQCRAQLWLYKPTKKGWQNVVDSPGSITDDYKRTGRIHWSEDGRWVAWSTTEEVQIYAVEENWRMARYFELSGFDSLPADPWLEDSNGNSIFTVNRVDFSSYPGLSIEIIGLSPNGNESNDEVLLRIEEDAKWLPPGATFTPFMWSP